MKKMIAPVSLMALMLSVYFAACKHEVLDPALGTGGGPVTGGTQPCSTDTVYFQNQVLPLLISSCAMSGCHDVASHQEGVVLTNYSYIINTTEVKPGDPGGSDIYKQLNKSGNDRMPPPPAAPFTDVQKSIIYKWIQQGAKNNACYDCDTAGVMKYSQHIAPLMQNFCNGCHSGVSAGGGFDLTTYNGVKAVVTNGKLSGSLNWAPGFSAMPKNGNKLPACKLTQVQKWIAAGAPNN